MGGQCRNTPGSFQCICPPGTQHNSQTQTCDDINECDDEEGSEACINGECINTQGSYECECEPGFVLDNSGRVCLGKIYNDLELFLGYLNIFKILLFLLDNRKGTCWLKLVHGQCEKNLPKLVLRQECCCTVGLAWGSPCEACDLSICDCPKGYAKVNLSIN